MVRVIGGTARGRPLRAPRDGLRPTSDRVREAIFDVLSSLGAVEEATVLDLFAGSGALGIEALSRGAAGATFVEDDPGHVDAIRANLEATGLSGRTVVVRRADAAAFLATDSASYSLCFCDPPYSFADWETLLPVLPGSLVVLESRRPIELDERHELHRVYRYGGTLVTVARRTPAPGGGGGGSAGGDGR